MKPKCVSKVPYATNQSSRVMPDGKKRYTKGARCLKDSFYLDNYGDGWCEVHAQNPNVILKYGPMTKLQEPKPDPDASTLLNLSSLFALWGTTDATTCPNAAAVTETAVITGCKHVETEDEHRSRETGQKIAPPIKSRLKKIPKRIER